MQTWGNAIQPDAARTALINQRARLLEQTGRLAEAEQALRASLLTDPNQPDAVQHWLHHPPEDVRLADPGRPDPRPHAPGPAHPVRPAAALAMTDQVAEQHAICGHLARRKTTRRPSASSPAARLPPRPHPRSATCRRISAATP